MGDIGCYLRFGCFCIILSPVSVLLMEAVGLVGTGFSRILEYRVQVRSKYCQSSHLAVASVGRSVVYS